MQIYSQICSEHWYLDLYLRRLIFPSLWVRSWELIRHASTSNFGRVWKWICHLETIPLWTIDSFWEYRNPSFPWIFTMANKTAFIATSSRSRRQLDGLSSHYVRSICPLAMSVHYDRSNVVESNMLANNRVCWLQSTCGEFGNSDTQMATGVKVFFWLKPNFEPFESQTLRIEKWPNRWKLAKRSKRI